MALGTGDYRYERVEGWAHVPEYFVVGDAVDGVEDETRRTREDRRADRGFQSTVAVHHVLPL